jgi:hypothetical protein
MTFTDGQAGAFCGAFVFLLILPVLILLFVRKPAPPPVVLASDPVDRPPPEEERAEAMGYRTAGKTPPLPSTWETPVRLLGLMLRGTVHRKVALVFSNGTRDAIKLWYARDLGLFAAQVEGKVLHGHDLADVLARAFPLGVPTMSLFCSVLDER